MRNPEKILIIDDEPDMVEILTIGLESIGYKVTSAYNGEAALQRLKDDKPDIVLLDVILPPKGGLEVLKVMKKEKDYKSIPVIMLTAAATDNKDRELIHRLGVDVCISKPFDRADLISCIREVLKKKSSYTSPASDYSDN